MAQHDDAAFMRAFTERRQAWIMTSWLGMVLSAFWFVLLVLAGLVVRWVVRGFTPRGGPAPPTK